MATYSELMPHRYYRADDFTSGPKVLTIKNIAIENVAREDADEEQRPILRFVESPMGLAINQERRGALESLFGAEVENCYGQRVKLSQGKTRFGGKLVNCVTISAATESKAAA